MKNRLPVLTTGLSRRAFVKAAGAAAAAVGAGACWQPPKERILPYAEGPPELVPGVPVSYATASILDGYATGLLVQAREGRPIKVEGNPSHPASLGATSIFDQAILLDLYAADRIRGVSGPHGAASRRAAIEAIRPSDAGGGEGVAILLEPTSSSLRGALLEEMQGRFPALQIYFHSAAEPSGALDAYRRGAGRPLVSRYDFGLARTVVALDADFITSMPYALRYAHDFASRHSVVSTAPERLNRLYLAEPSPSGASPLADHLLRVRSGDVIFVLAELVRALGGRVDGLPRFPSVWTGSACGPGSRRRRAICCPGRARAWSSWATHSRRRRTRSLTRPTGSSGRSADRSSSRSPRSSAPPRSTAGWSASPSPFGPGAWSASSSSAETPYALRPPTSPSGTPWRARHVASTSGSGRTPRPRARLGPCRRSISSRRGETRVLMTAP